MGRELRMVPPNYQHPQVLRSYGEIGYQPMLNRDYSEAVDEYRTEFARWRVTECPTECVDPVAEFEEYYGPAPKPQYYRTYRLEDATWYQLWETVSEGTPVTPAFATKEELVNYLVEHGDFWDQQRRKRGVTSIPCGPWKREEAESLVFGSGWKPTLMVMVDRPVEIDECRIVRDETMRGVRKSEKARRNLHITSVVLRGDRMTDVAKLHGITPTCVRYIVHRTLKRRNPALFKSLASLRPGQATPSIGDLATHAAEFGFSVQPDGTVDTSKED